MEFTVLPCLAVREIVACVGDSWIIVRERARGRLTLSNRGQRHERKEYAGGQHDRCLMQRSQLLYTERGARDRAPSYIR